MFASTGYNVKVVTTDKYVKCDSGLLYLDIEEGQGDLPKEGQEVRILVCYNAHPCSFYMGHS